MKIFHNILYKFLRLFLIIILFFSFCNFYKEENKEIHQEEIIYEAKQETINDEQDIQRITLTLDDIKRLFSRNKYLSDEIVDLLYNEDLFIDILPIINDYEDVIYLLMHRIKNISIEEDNLDIYSRLNTVYAYYNYIFDTIYLNEELDDYLLNDVLIHEFMHALQPNIEYIVLAEAFAEIMSREYYDEANDNSYYPESYITMKLMEIIGSEPVLHYNLIGDTNIIDDAVKPHLSMEDFETFKKYILNRIDYPEQFEVLDNILNNLYENKYPNRDKDDVFKILDNAEDIARIGKYYFNPRYID